MADAVLGMTCLSMAAVGAVLQLGGHTENLNECKLDKLASNIFPNHNNYPRTSWHWLLILTPPFRTHWRRGSRHACCLPSGALPK